MNIADIITGGIVTSYSGCFTSLCLSPQLFFCGNDPCMAAVGHSPWQGEGEWVSQSPTHRDTPLDSDPKPYIQSHHLGENIFHQVIFLLCFFIYSSFCVYVDIHQKILNMRPLKHH